MRLGFGIDDILNFIRNDLGCVSFLKSKDIPNKLGDMKGCSRIVAFGSDVMNDKGHPHLSHNGDVFSLKLGGFSISS